MNSQMKSSLLAAVALALFAVSTAPARATAQEQEPMRTERSWDPALLTRAERSNFEETSTLEDVTRFLDALTARSPLVRVQTFGTSETGRPLLLVSLSDPAVGQPRDLNALDRPVVFIQANIHGGEVEGKEAVQNLMRRLTLGDLRPLLDRMVVLIAPIYNVDGNEAFDVNNRTAQYGPIAGVGRRTNDDGLDLNRDYMKLESAEARALVQLFTDWDPHLMVDLHTTNGSTHGYHLTYSIPLNLTLDPILLDFHRERMMPALEQALLERHGFRSYYYGNFDEAPDTAESDLRRWVAFDHRPRAGQNYYGFRNRLTILSEAYSYLDFETRIAVTEAFVEEILRFVDANARDIMALTAELDRELVDRAAGDEALAIGVEFELVPLPEPVPILVGEVRHELNPRNGQEMTVVVPNRFEPEMMWDYAVFAPVREVPMARAYVLPREEAMRPAIANLRQHGILVEELTAPLTTEVTSFHIETAAPAEREFQGHHEMRLTGSYVTERTTLPAGTIIVRLAQPLGRLAAYLLEPESDDGLVNWNFFDDQLRPGGVAPVRKITGNVSFSARLLEGF